MPKREGPRKPTPEEVLRSIEESTVDDEIERVLAMSPEERDREFVEAGFDLEELDAQANALHARIQGASAGSAEEAGAKREGEEEPASEVNVDAGPTGSAQEAAREAVPGTRGPDTKILS